MRNFRSTHLEPDQPVGGRVVCSMKMTCPLINAVCQDVDSVGRDPGVHSTICPAAQRPILLKASSTPINSSTMARFFAPLALLAVAAFAGAQADAVADATNAAGAAADAVANTTLADVADKAGSLAKDVADTITSAASGAADALAGAGSEIKDKASSIVGDLVDDASAAGSAVSDKVGPSPAPSSANVASVAAVSVVAVVATGFTML